MADEKIDHFERAEGLLAKIARTGMEADVLIAYASAAQAHATLALAEATREARRE